MTNSLEDIFSPGLCRGWQIFANTAPGCCQPCKVRERTCLSQAFTCSTFISQKCEKELVPHEMLIQNEEGLLGQEGDGDTLLGGETRTQGKRPGEESTCHLLWF